MQYLTASFPNWMHLSLTESPAGRRQVELLWFEAYLTEIIVPRPMSLVPGMGGDSGGRIMSFPAPFNC